MTDLSIHSSAYHLHALGHAAETAQPARMPNEIVEMSEFNLRAGIHQLMRNYHFGQKMIPLTQRRLSSAFGSSHTSSESTKNAHSLIGDLEVAATQVIEDLQRNERSEMEARLIASYDVLERHTLLRAVKNQLSSKNLSQEEEGRLNGILDEMLDDLMKTDGDAIRAGLRDAQALEQAIGTMEEFERKSGNTRIPGTLPALRALYEAKRSTGVEGALTPLVLANILLDKFGSENFSNALLTLRTRMAAGLRTEHARNTGPRLWLSLSDAASFNAVQSVFFIAGDFRRNLSERAGITPSGSQAETALVLLALPDTGGQAEAIAAKITRQKQMGTLQRIQVFMLLRYAVESLSLSLWDSRGLQQRLLLLDELRVAVFAVSDKLVRPPSEEKELERQLRDEHDRKRRRKHNGEEEDEEGSAK